MFFSRVTKKTDEALMRSVRHGDERAMTELYHRYSKNLLRYFHRMLWKEEAIAQDFLQDLFMKILENADKYQEDKKFSTWLYSIAHNMCKNEYRKRAFREALSNTNFAEGPPEDITHRQLVEKEFLRALDDALEKLDPEEKNLFLLRHEMEMPLEEIAQILDCPTGTVKSRLFYIKKKLAIRLYDYHPVNE
jgi:RNA polymerase sigma-70 factor (ECF subfamily)